MNITVKFYCKYKEVIIEDGGTSFETGFLGEKEAKELAAAFTEAAEELLRE